MASASVIGNSDVNGELGHIRGTQLQEKSPLLRTLASVSQGNIISKSHEPGIEKIRKQNQS